MTIRMGLPKIREEVIDAMVHHRLRKAYWDIWKCSCEEWELRDGVYGESPPKSTVRAHATHVTLRAGLR